MLEPKPLNVAEKEVASSEIRVGILLLEDGKNTASIHIDAPIRCLNDNSPQALSEGRLVEPGKYSVIARDETVELRNESGEILQSTECLFISPSKSAFPKKTLSISPIVAGRSFHWKKEIQADFPGVFEIKSHNGFLEIVNILPFEHYLACVVVSEMSSGTPVEFVKAQTIVARSWAKCFLNEKHPGSSYELCNDDDCQRYHGVTFAAEDSLNASLQTAGQYLVSEAGTIVPAYYSKCCGGISEKVEDCFGFPAAGISSVTDGPRNVNAHNTAKWTSSEPTEDESLFCGGDPDILLAHLGGVDDAGEYFRWKHREEATSLASYLNERTGVTDARIVTDLNPIRRGKSGRIHEMEFIFETIAGNIGSYHSRTQYEIRSLLHPSFLFSSSISITKEAETFLFHGAGWGHGVGLCQIGGMFQAIAGRNNRDILNTYFPRAVIKTLY